MVFQTLYLLTVLVLNLSKTSFSLSCGPGTFSSSSQCELCPPGTYNNNFSKTECVKCSPGTFYPFKGGIGFSNCLKCPYDTYSPIHGAISEKVCLTCPDGSYSQSGSSNCLSCPEGFGIALYKTEKCLQCEAGFYNDGSFKFCRQCPSGTMANKNYGATKCIPCAKGKFRDVRYIQEVYPGRFKCNKCPENTFTKKMGTQQCELCPLGTFSEIGAEECKPCLDGTFRGKLKSKKCVKCPAGTSSKGPAAACRHPLHGCPFDTFQDKSGTCRACKPGERLDISKMECVKCSPSEASRGGATTTCEQCAGDETPASDVTVYEKSECQCKLGYIRAADGSCEPCPAGWYGSVQPAQIFNNFYRSNYATIIQPFCGVCPRGTYSKPGSVKCEICPPGTISKDASASCSKCPPGSRTGLSNKAIYNGGNSLIFDSARQCITKKFSCPLGQIRSAKNNCIPGEQRCPWPTRRAFDRRCRVCLSYQYWNTTSQKCKNCPFRMTNEGSRVHTNTKCVRCPQNAYLFKGKCICYMEYIMVGKTCQKCPDGLVERNGSCVKCRSGVTPFNGGKDDGRCGLCLGDKYLPDGAKKCVRCPEGYKKMLDVAGTPLNQCAPADRYQKQVESALDQSNSS